MTGLDHEKFQPNFDRYKFTAILCTYNRPALMKEAVAALCRQTYQNMEIILINNGGTPETSEHLNQVAAGDSRVKLVNFEENVYSPDDPGKYVEVCFNAALDIATGDYIWCQSDDDFIADDYAEKMVALFRDNPECTTAAGIPVSIDIHGNINETGPRVSNYRPRYMAGHELALDYIRGGREIYNTPGTIFSIRRDVYVSAGGIRQPIEYMHLFGIVPFGETGFDPTAISYWRHHEGQLNREATARGLIGALETFRFLKEWQIEQRWQVFGRDTAREVVALIVRDQCERGASWMTRYLYSGSMSAAIRLTRTMWKHPQFWILIPPKAIVRLFYTNPMGLIARPLIRRGFRILPELANLSPGLSRLRDKVNRKTKANNE